MLCLFYIKGIVGRSFMQLLQGGVSEVEWILGMASDVIDWRWLEFDRGMYFTACKLQVAMVVVEVDEEVAKELAKEVDKEM